MYDPMKWPRGTLTTLITVTTLVKFITLTTLVTCCAQRPDMALLPQDISWGHT